MKLARAAALSIIFCWVWIAPSPALAQLGLGGLVVNIASPASGSTVSSSITVSWTAVPFLPDAATLGAEDTTSPYAGAWDTTTASNGSHTLAARARDAAGNATTSNAVTATVSNGSPPDNTPPTVSITSPSSG